MKQTIQDKPFEFIMMLNSTKNDYTFDTTGEIGLTFKFYKSGRLLKEIWIHLFKRWIMNKCLNILYNNLIQKKFFNLL